MLSAVLTMDPKEAWGSLVASVLGIYLASEHGDIGPRGYGGARQAKS